MRLLQHLKRSNSYSEMVRQSLYELSGHTPLQLKHHLKKDWCVWCNILHENGIYDKVNDIVSKKYSRNIEEISKVSPIDIEINENVYKKGDTENTYKDITFLLEDYNKITLNALMWASLCKSTGNKMRLQKYINEQKHDYSQEILEIFMMIHQDELLNESIDLNKILQKIGFTFSKEKGLVHILSGAGKHMFDLFKQLFIAWYTGKEEEKQKVKEIIDSSKITKEHIADFLFKLDEATLHLITGPLYLLSAITGWKIRPQNPEKKNMVQSTENKLKDAIQKLSSVVSELPKKIAKNFKSYLRGMSNLVCRDLGVCLGENE